MSRKITQEEFLKRFYSNYPEADITVLEYTAIKSPVKIKCNKCGAIIEKDRAEYIVRSWTCCGQGYVKRIEIVKKRYHEMGDEYSIIKQAKNPQYWIVRHNKCGNQMERTAQAMLNHPCGCIYCDTQSTNLRLTFEEASQQILETFGGRLSLLEYYGVDAKKNKYRCNQCGLIFNHDHYSLIHQCRGCPKCDKRRSKGEQFIEQILQDKGLQYKTQVQFLELGSLKFDFGVYKDGILQYLIEVQGEQHYRPAQWSEHFEERLRRDNDKRQYCKEHNIPLYELPWDGRAFKNLDILPI